MYAERERAKLIYTHPHIHSKVTFTLLKVLYPKKSCSIRERVRRGSPAAKLLEFQVIQSPWSLRIHTPYAKYTPAASTHHTHIQAVHPNRMCRLPQGMVHLHPITSPPGYRPNALLRIKGSQYLLRSAYGLPTLNSTLAHSTVPKDGRLSTLTYFTPASSLVPESVFNPLLS